jgi:hypothetical protein
MSPLERFVARHARMERTEGVLVQPELPLLDEINKVSGTVREIQNLLLVRKLSTSYGHAFKKRFHLRKCEWIAFEHARVPDILREHPGKAEHHPVQRGTRKLPRNTVSVPSKAE